ncbi:MAG: ATP synthase F1 subunit gamma [Clostridium sp.]|nr:ATP synthase F1 subunit gamma [Clostridium sp.]MCM1171725.1 ATP synthase F1 subunit gamma [Clostridium sp.]MCM1207387.1 ATP synthase F1 subunit gamma [Ruminococcus sp.]
MASMRDIKRRKESVQSTQQITKAMKLVATVKLQKARGKAESNKPYFGMLYDTICSILAMTKNVDHEYLKESECKKKAVIVITSNRGLAGGYNSNIVKMVAGADFPKEDTYVYAVGRKGIEGLTRKGYSVYKDFSEVINEPLFSDATNMSKELLTQYSKGEIGEIYIAYTNFKNTVTQEPKLVKLLPLSEDEFVKKDENTDAKLLMNFEPTPEEVLDMIIPKYMSNIIFGAFLESVASENGARMQAMDSATSNAEDMIASLSLKYNRARQGAITQELTEIIAGADAIS